MDSSYPLRTDISLSYIMKEEKKIQVEEQFRASEAVEIDNKETFITSIGSLWFSNLAEIVLFDFPVLP